MPDLPTLRDVAAAAGVSKSTAQRALANDPECSEKTREKVQKIAEDLHYVPDPLFAAVGTRKLSKRTHGTPIAYLVALPEGQQKVGQPHFDSCQARAAEIGYRLEYIDISQLESPKQLWQLLYARGFAGVLVGSVRANFHPLIMENQRFPLVCVGRIDHLPFHTTRPAIQLGVLRTWREMTACGYRRIAAAIFKHNPPVEDDFSRYSAIVGLQRMDFPDDDQIPPFTSDFSDREGFLRWVKQHQPDAVLGFHEGLYFDLKDAGYKIPRDLGFASLHKNPKNIDPKISGIYDNPYFVAISAVNLLDQMIRHGERGLPSVPVNIMVEGTWTPGKTLRPQRK